MKIKSKILIIVLPILIVPLVLMGFSASLSARNGITQIATDFLQFKADTLENYSLSQWQLLEDNNLTGSKEFITAAEGAVESFARTLVKSKTEVIFAVDKDGKVKMATGEITILEDEASALRRIFSEKKSGWFSLSAGGRRRVAQGFYLEPYHLFVFVTELTSTFYSSVKQIYLQSSIILLTAALLSMILLGIFINYVTSPLRNIVGVMREIIAENDLSKRVPVLYKDEIGELGHTFNLMSSELERAYNQVKNYAYKAVVAEKDEKKIRNIFQKYVPHDVIEQFFNSPDDMLKGKSRELAILFSDIRGFTTLSENMRPEMVVESLNHYFSDMVDIIVDHKGIVDKYMGDAIMSFFGAPVKHKNDSLLAVQSALEMLETLKEFNKQQTENSRPPFRIGIGINYGPVTVGNIGSEKKMDYTVIGDMVNTASRLEGLTKVYSRPLIVSASVYEMVKKDFPCLFIDKVAVKGRKQGIPIYSVQKSLSSVEKEAYQAYSEGIRRYLKREFSKALNYFWNAQTMLPSEKIFEIYINRALKYQENPPPEDWTGVTIMEHK